MLLLSVLCLGMGEWTDSPWQGVNATPHPQITAIDRQAHPSTSSSSANQVLPLERFNISSEDELQDLSKGHAPANTARSTQWALKVFQLWKETRNERFPENAGLVTVAMFGFGRENTELLFPVVTPT